MSIDILASASFVQETFSPLAAIACLLYIPAGLAFVVASYLLKAKQEGTIEDDDDDEEYHDVRRVEEARAFLQALEASKPRALEEVVVEMIPLVMYTGSGTKGTTSTYGIADSSPMAIDDLCVVCLSPFEEGDMVKLLPPCDHCFHVGCIDPWFHTHSTCPLCRRKVALPNTLPPIDLQHDHGHHIDLL